MVSESQAAHVVALVNERHEAAKQAFDKLLDAYASGEQEKIISANEKLRDSLKQLKSVVAVEHWPAWLRDLTQNAERYVNQHSKGLPTWRAHLNSAMRNATPLEQENWAFTEEEPVLFDVDAIVAKARAEHKIDALYERITSCLQALLDSDQIDSVKASADLSRLIASLRKAQVGSFSSQVLNWRFARRLVPNIVSAYVKRSSITGPIIEAFEQTANELDISLDQAKDQIGTEILSAASAVLRTDTANQIGSDSLLFLEEQPARARRSDELDTSREPA